MGVGFALVGAPRNGFDYYNGYFLAWDSLCDVYLCSTQGHCEGCGIDQPVGTLTKSDMGVFICK